jgi:hypothetical protein
MRKKLMFLSDEQLDMEYMYISFVKFAQLANDKTLYQKLLSLKFSHDNNVIDFDFYKKSYYEIINAYENTKLLMPKECLQILTVGKLGADANSRIIGLMAFIEYWNYFEEYEKCAEYKKAIIKNYLSEEKYIELYNYIITNFKMDWSILDK